jgi:Copine
VKFTVCNFKASGTHPIYGEVTCTVADLLDAPTKNHELRDASGAIAGTLLIEGFNLISRPSFVEYLRSGWFINMSVAIDFTASNGELTDPVSLHRLSQNGQLNDYEQAISSVGSILEPYAFDRKFALFGFGGIPRFTGATSVSHCFNLTGTTDPTVDGLLSMFNLYKSAVQGTSLSGPTYFSPVLSAVLEYMKAAIQLPMYHILLILTDGVIHDMKQTKDLIVECSKYPLSIIIVGIGNADFANMEQLDGDDVVLRNSKGEPTLRDIVQFVEFNEHKGQDLGRLAEEVLKEVPDQLVGYMMSKGIEPKPQPLMS